MRRRGGGVSAGRLKTGGCEGRHGGSCLQHVPAVHRVLPQGVRRSPYEGCTLNLSTSSKLYISRQRVVNHNLIPSKPHISEKTLSSKLNRLKPEQCRGLIKLGEGRERGERCLALAQVNLLGNLQASSSAALGGCRAMALSCRCKPRRLLELLLRADGGLVTKDTIAAAVWSSEVPSDPSLARAAQGLRL
jgi:hypothetical protein